MSLPLYKVSSLVNLGWDDLGFEVFVNPNQVRHPAFGILSVATQEYVLSLLSNLLVMSLMTLLTA